MKSRIRNTGHGAAVVAVLTMLTACGGSDSGLPPTYTVGGTVTGFSGSGLVLHNGGGADLPISASGAFTFATRMPSGTNYAVTVKSSPTAPPQVCTVAGGVGIIASTDVTNVDVTCVAGRSITIGGTLSGLQHSGLVLQLLQTIGCPHDCFIQRNVGPPLRITSNGPFTFDVVLPDKNAGYLSVLLARQPAAPAQLCVIRNANIGTIDTQGAPVTDVEVVCSQFSYVANATDNGVSAYTVDATSGALAAVGPPVATGGALPHAIVGTRDKKYVYVANERSNDISGFAVNSASGVLTAVPGSPFAAVSDPKALALWGTAPGGTYLYVANASSDTVSARWDTTPIPVCRKS